MNASRASGSRRVVPPLRAGGLLGLLLAAAGLAAAGLIAAGPLARAQGTGDQPAGPISLFPPTVTAPAPGGATAPALGESTGDSGETRQYGDIEVNRLGELDPESLGILDLDHGGLGIDAWAGSDRLATEALLRDLPADLASPTLRQVVTRLLLSSARAPAPVRSARAQTTMADAIAAAQSGDFLRLRAERLYDLGELAGLNRLLGLVPQHVEDPWLTRARVEGLLLAGRDSEACAQVPAGLSRYPQDLYWAKAQVFCQFAAGQTDQALLGLDLLREQAPDSDPAFFAASNLFIGASATDLNGSNLTPLTLAMLRKAGGSLPADALERAGPLLLHGIAGLAGGDHAVHAGAVERLVEMGALPGERLAGAYNAFEFTEAELGDALNSAGAGSGVRGRALLYRAANRESLIATRAEILRAAFLSAEDDGRASAMARAVLPLMTEVAPTPDLAWFAPLAARTLYRAGQYERAGAWLSVLRADGLRNPESQAAYAALRPFMRLAGGAEPLAEGAAADAAGAAMPQAQRLLLFVLSRALGQGEDLAWVEAGDAEGGVQPLARVPRLLALGDAAAAGRRGDAVLLIVSALGAGAPADSHPLALGYAVSALNAIGLGADARALAIEAALAAGL